jgi:16S rRNA (guanine527-N7)-methyltransferase
VISASAIGAGASALGVALGVDQASVLAKLAALLIRWNRTHNLISKRDEARILPRHLLDSLSLAPFLHGSRILDVGTGAGLPGIPLAVADPERSFVLLDRSERKLKFARQATIELGLDNVEIVCADVAEYRPGVLFDTVVARAVAEPIRLWRAIRHVLAPDGIGLFASGNPEGRSLLEELPQRSPEAT